jgi:very-long-chain enoyl-CoA reductase
VSRQKLTLKGERKALDNETFLRDAGMSDGGELFVKDLGAQISWKTVFVVEYVSSICVSAH